MSRQMTATADARQIQKPSINHIEDVNAIYLPATYVKYELPRMQLSLVSQRIPASALSLAANM
jgi:hypothetical protein